MTMVRAVSNALCTTLLGTHYPTIALSYDFTTSLPLYPLALLQRKSLRERCTTRGNLKDDALSNMCLRHNSKSAVDGTYHLLTKVLLRTYRPETHPKVHALHRIYLRNQGPSMPKEYFYANQTSMVMRWVYRIVHQLARSPDLPQTCK